MWRHDIVLERDHWSQSPSVGETIVSKRSQTQRMFHCMTYLYSPLQHALVLIPTASGCSQHPLSSEDGIGASQESHCLFAL